MDIFTNHDECERHQLEAVSRALERVKEELSRKYDDVLHGQTKKGWEFYRQALSDVDAYIDREIDLVDGAL